MAACKFGKRFHVIDIFLILLAGAGCEKIIDVELNDANPQIVIEGICLITTQNWT